MTKSFCKGVIKGSVPGTDPFTLGYQWTRKVAQKTITVALSAEQFRSLKNAIANHRTLQKTLTQMEKLSRQILFETLPDTNRRKQLPKRVLGTI